jgi:hypothetical protein
MLTNMKAISIHIENGRITGTAPEGLPDGDFEVALVEAEDEMAEEESIRLEAALQDGLNDVKQGRTRSAVDLAAALLRRHA